MPKQAGEPPQGDGPMQDARRTPTGARARMTAHPTRPRTAAPPWCQAAARQTVSCEMNLEMGVAWFPGIGLDDSWGVSAGNAPPPDRAGERSRRLAATQRGAGPAFGKRRKREGASAGLKCVPIQTRATWQRVASKYGISDRSIPLSLKDDDRPFPRAPARARPSTPHTNVVPALAGNRN